MSDTPAFSIIVNLALPGYKAEEGEAFESTGVCGLQCRYQVP